MVEHGQLPAKNHFLFRPIQSLQDLSLRHRWEVVRRHPYYLTHWQFAHRLYTDELTGELAETLGKVAQVVLLNIGVTGDPPPPTTTFDELSVTQLARAWGDGAIAPITFRALIQLLIRDLPSDTRRVVGQTLLDSAAVEADEVQTKFDASLGISRSDAAGLSATPNRPIVGLNIYAPQRAIVEAVESLVRSLKEAEKIPERRRRDDLVEPYLEVWDLREGWTGGGYDIAQERSFRELAQDMSLRTAANRYYSAFEIVTGHSYSLENWVKVFAPVKLTDAHGIRSLGRRHAAGPRRDRSVSAVSESTLSGGYDIRDGGPLACESDDTEDWQNGIDLMLDVAGFVKEGMDANAILDRLGVERTAETLSLIVHFVNRAREQVS